MCTRQHAHADTMGRLWWFEDGVSCAYRDAADKPIYYEGYSGVKWETAAVCDITPTAVNVMADANGGQIQRAGCTVLSAVL